MNKIPERMQVPVQRVDLASIIESSDDAIVGMTTSGVISSCNRAATLLYGYRAQDLIGDSAQLLIPPELRMEQADILSRVVAGEDVHGYRTQQMRHDGARITVSLTLSPIRGSDDAIIGAATIAYRVPARQTDHDHVDSPDPTTHPQPGRDETGVNRNQDAQDRRFQANIDGEYARERLLVYAAQDRFEVLMDEERAHERVQVQQAQDLFQLRMDNERAQEQVDVQQAQDQFQLRMGLERAQERLRVEQAQDQFQVTMETERAQERIQVEHAQDQFQMTMDTGRAQARTDREHLQAQIHQGQRLEVLGQLAGGIAHDFNNLLGVILNFAAFVAEELATRPGADLEAASNDVAQIQRAAERATGLTHQLLAFARREIVQPRVLDLNDVVTDVEQLLRRTLGEDILLSSDPAPHLWPVLADAGQIEQVLVNLAVNARDAMSDTGTLRIDTANVLLDAPTDTPLHPGRHVRLRVSDTGTGMPPEIQEHVFEPFFTTKREGAGTGLGLSTVHGIITQTGGTITIHSQPGAGTTLTILLPVTTEVADPINDVQPYHRTPTGETVLIVEDQEALREITERIFTRNGYHVLTAADGAQVDRR